MQQPVRSEKFLIRCQFMLLVFASCSQYLGVVKWMVLSGSVSVHNKYTLTAKSVLKMCRNQMTEIETCPDCFLASCTQEHNWFCKPCVS